METLHDERTVDRLTDTDEVSVLDRFIPYIGERFNVASLPDVSLQIELVEAKASSGRAGTPQEDSFSLIFRAARNCPLDQGSVALEHAGAGWIVVFLVPIGEDQDGQYFEAIFD